MKYVEEKKRIIVMDNDLTGYNTDEWVVIMRQLLGRHYKDFKGQGGGWSFSSQHEETFTNMLNETFDLEIGSIEKNINKKYVSLRKKKPTDVAEENIVVEIEQVETTEEPIVVETEQTLIQEENIVVETEQVVVPEEPIVVETEQTLVPEEELVVEEQIVVETEQAVAPEEQIVVETEQVEVPEENQTLIPKQTKKPRKPRQQKTAPKGKQSITIATQTEPEISSYIKPCFTTENSPTDTLPHQYKFDIDKNIQDFIYNLVGK